MHLPVGPHHRSGFGDPPGLEAATPDALADLAARGLGVAIVPGSVAGERTDVHAVSIRPELRGRLVLAWRATGPISPAARVLIEMAAELVGGGA